MSFEVQAIGAATLYLGDAREVVECVDINAQLGLLDPPYLLTSGGKNGNASGMSGMSGKFAKGRYNNGGQFVTCAITWDEIARVIKAGLQDDADAIVMANDKEIFRAYAALMHCGFQHHNLFAWDKVTATPNRWGMKNLEYAVFVWLGRARALQDCSIKQLMRAPLRAESAHPTEKPVGLMRRWIEAATRAGEIVYDPFMGSGTTGVAAVQSGRRFVGIEFEREWFDVACARCERALDQREMFGVAS